MRVRISDKQVLQSITPVQLMAYLRSKGATQLDEYPGKATIWQYGSEELLVPLATRFADYPATSLRHWNGRKTAPSCLSRRICGTAVSM